MGATEVVAVENSKTRRYRKIRKHRGTGVDENGVLDQDLSTVSGVKSKTDILVKAVEIAGIIRVRT